MKIETVARDDQQTKLIAELDSETLEKYKHQAARKISQSQKIPGFRPGKAPYDLVRRMVGDEALQQEAIELMLDTVYPQVIKEANVNPSGPGKLEEIVSMDPPTFAFIVPLPPEVALGDYKELRKEYTPEQVTDEQVETSIQRLLRSYATAEPVEREAQKGDLVSFKMSAKRLNPAEGENDTLIEESPYQNIAGEEDEEGQSWPYAGFTNELVGTTIGQTKTFTHTFTDESPYEDLRGKEAEFTIVVDGIKEMHLPELNDEFAQSLGDFENLEALRKAIRTQLEQNASQQYDQEYFDSLITSLVEQSTVKYPPHMLEDEITEFLEGLQRNLERDHLDLETYLKMREMDRATFIEAEVKQAATSRLLRSLVLEEFARQEKVEGNNQEIQAIYYSAMQQMKSQEASKARSQNKQSTQEMANSIAINTVNSIYNQRMMSRLKAIATGKGDEQPEPDVLSELMSVADGQPETALDENVESENVTGPASGLEEVQMDAITSENEAEEEQAVAEDNLLTEEPPQGDTGTGESGTENESASETAGDA